MSCLPVGMLRGRDDVMSVCGILMIGIWWRMMSCLSAGTLRGRNNVMSVYGNA
jgi:hypothetical protein